MEALAIPLDLHWQWPAELNTMYCIRGISSKIVARIVFYAFWTSCAMCHVKLTRLSRAQS